MKHNGYDVYDILYRNDGVVRSLLEKDILYMKTGLITLRDTDNRIWYLYKRANLLIPGIVKKIFFMKKILHFPFYVILYIYKVVFKTTYCRY